MRILAVADVQHKALYDHFDPGRWRSVDLVISCGDLKPEYLSFLVTMINKQLLYVPGNHDESYEKAPPEGCDSVDGRVISVKGIKVGGLGGSIWYNGKDLQYTEKQMARRVGRLIRLARRAGGIDVFVSHAPPKGIHDLLDKCHTGFDSFRTLMKELRPKVVLHGHNHEVYGGKERETVVDGIRVINACGYYDVEL
jgi:Icc-related predicted phosphoesterase